MNQTDSALALKPGWKTYRSPQTVIGRFVARRTVRMAAFWALVFGAFVAAKAIGYATAYPTLAERAQIATSFGNNIGLSALLGVPRHIETVAGFTTWNTLGAMMIIGAIWAFLLATKTFRGEEEAGRWEMLLAGQTTARQAAVNTLAGLSASVVVFYLVAAVTFSLVGQVQKVDFGISAALFFALAAVAAAVEFMAVGALASQLMPTRRRAAGLSAAVFGICFLIRAMADTTSAHWLLNITPLGWIEKLQPLYGSRPVWLLPIAGFTLALAVLAVYLAGRRDLGDSVFADHDTAQPKTGLLNGPLAVGFRLTWPVSLSWLAGLSFMGFFFGLLTKSAAQALQDSLSAQHLLSKLARASQTTGAVTFLGIAFFMLMTLTMAYTASAVGSIREDEAQGYLDNLLVRPLGRLQWFAGRIALIAGVIVLAGLIAVLAIWTGESSQHAGVTFHPLLQAGVNLLAPALLTLGIGVFALGVVPRLTSVVAYSVIAWSFLIEMVSSGINLNHWIQDTSILHHVALAPAATPNWGTDLKLVLLGAGLMLAGLWVFRARDLQAE